jgi:hypothetical protein
MRLVAFLLIVCLAGALLRAKTPSAPSQTVTPPPTIVVRLIFGLQDPRPTDWNGSVTAVAGRIQAIEGWRLLQGDAVTPDGRWTARSRLAPSAPTPINVPGVPPEPTVQAPQPVGVTLTLPIPAPERLQIRTAQGDFDVRPADLQLGQPQAVLEGRARVELLPTPLLVAEAPAYNDYPALASDRHGGLWVAWAAYQDRADTVHCRHFDGTSWSEAEAVSPKPGDVNRPACAVDGRGRPWVVWSAREGTNWDLWARHRDPNGWSAPERLTTSPESDIEPRLIADAQGHLLLVWQGFRKGQAHILARQYSGERWQAEQRIDADDADDWDPALAVDSRGTVAVAWDTYAGGSYNVRLRLWRDGSWGCAQAVTATSLFQAHPSLAFGPDNRLWIAWDESGPNWGKDTGFLVEKPGTRLYQGRRIRIAVVDDTPSVRDTVPLTAAGALSLRTPAADIHTVLPESSVAVCEMPQLAFDRSGRLWTLFRRRTARTPRRDGWAAGGVWDFYATACDGKSWCTPFALPQSTGRNDMRAAWANDPKGRLWVAWATDNRTWQAPAPKRLDVQMALVDEPTLASNRVQQPSGPPLSIENPTVAPIHPNENADVARIRAYRLDVDGRRYRILRGDLHRHTDNSADGVGDGSLEDLYRYALDAARMDYILVTDHNDGNDAEYPWWRREKSNDLYFAPGRFVPLYGYERSVPYPNGHRNVLFPERGVRTLPIRMPEQRGETDTGPILYPYLRDHQGIATSHTSATSQGTDWRDNDPALEPMVEIFQGYHTSYEHAGAPRAVDAKTGLVHGDYKPDGFVWNALARGYKLGFQASSDHISTHVSYACVLTENYSRQGIIDAFQQRHCYAATDNIVLDVRMGGHIMGDAFTTAHVPALEIHAIGTAPIRQVDVICNEKYLYTVHPGKSEVNLRYLPMDQAAGTSHYYIRIQQQDGQMAWASPLWVTVEAPRG